MLCTCEKTKAKLTPVEFRSVHPISVGYPIGRPWKEMCQNLGGLYVMDQSSSKMRLRSVSTNQVRELETAKSLPLNRKYFILQPEELLLKIDFCWDAGQSGGLRAVRLTTTMRESLWYGNCVPSAIETLAAPCGCFINGIYSSVLEDRVVELGVRFEPRDGRQRHDIADATCPLLYSPQELEVPVGKSTHHHQFTVSRYDLRAIALVWRENYGPSRVTTVDVLSHREYEQLVAANNKNAGGQAELAWLEDMLVLSVAGDDIEAITKVDVAFEDGMVVALRFTTSRGGQGLWMDEYNCDKQRVVSHTVPVNGGRSLKMTGFRGAYELEDGGSKKIVSLEPVFHPIE